MVTSGRLDLREADFREVPVMRPRWCLVTRSSRKSAMKRPDPAPISPGTRKSGPSGRR